MQVISSGGIPLALALGVRGYRLRARPGWLFAGWAGGRLAALDRVRARAAVRLPARACWSRSRPSSGGAAGGPRSTARLLIASVAGAALFVASSAALIARPYFRVADEHPEATRPPSTVEAFSGPLDGLHGRPDENFVWGEATAAHPRRPREHPREDPVPGARDPGAGDRRPRLVGFPRWLRLGLWRARRARGLRCSRSASTRTTAAVALPDRLRALAGLGGDPHPRAGSSRFASLGLALLAAAGADRRLAGARGPRCRDVRGAPRRPSAPSAPARRC